MNMTPMQAFSKNHILAVRRLNRMGLMLMVSFGMLITGLASAGDQTGAKKDGPIVQHGQTTTLKLPVTAQTQSQGATATLLPTGQWLLLGGQHDDHSAPVPDARLYDPVNQQIVPLPSGLVTARAYHTATLLPDGNVLVFGGSNHAGTVIETAEYFNPTTASSSVANLKLPARTQHRASLLVDGHVLITGGIDAHGEVLDDAILIDPRSNTVESISLKLNTARFNHLSALLPHHDVLIWGGVGKDGSPLNQAELYQPGESSFLTYDAATAEKRLAELNSPSLPILLDSEPKENAIDVASGQMLSLRFSKPLKVTSVNAQTVVLMGPNGPVPSTVTPTEGGLVVFVVPHQDLLPGANYTLLMQGAVDPSGQPLSFLSMGFATKALNTTATRQPGNDATRTALTTGTSNAGDTANTANTSSSTAANSAASLRIAAGAKTNAQVAADRDDDEVWIPSAQHRAGNWRSGRPLPESAADLLDNEPSIRHKIKAMRARFPQDKQKQAHAPSKASTSDTTTGVAGTVLRLNDQPLANVTVTVGTQSAHTDNQGHFELTGITPGHYEMVVDGSTANRPNHEYLQFVLGVDVQSDGLTELSHYLYMPRIRAEDWVDLPSPTEIATVVTHPAMPGLEIHIPKGTVFRDQQGKNVSRIAVVPVPLDRAPYPTPDAFPSYFMLHPGGAIIQGTGPEAAQGIRIIYPNNTQAAPGIQQHLWVYDPRSNGWVIYGHATVSADGRQIIPDAGVGLHEHMGAGHSAPSGAPGPQPPTPPDPCEQTPPTPGNMAGDPVECSTGLFFHQRTDAFLPDDIPIEIQRSYRPGDTVVRPFGKGTNYTYGMYLRAPNHDYSQIDFMLPDGRKFEFPFISGTNLHTDYVWEHTSTSGPFYRARIRAGVFTSGIFSETWDLHLQDGTVYFFSMFGQLIKIADRNGNTLTFTYNGGQLLRITSNSGRTLDFTYDASNRITQLKDILGRIWTYAYNAAGYLQKATYPDGTFEEYTYDTVGRMLTVKDRRGNNMVTNEYDANGRVSKQTLADGGIFTFAYTLDANGKVTQTDITDPRGTIERKQFNALGYLTSRTAALGKPEQQTIAYTRNASNFVTMATDALGRMTEYQYDTKGNNTQVTKLYGTPSAVNWNYTYEPVFNQVKTITDPLGHITTLSYDAQGNVTSLQDPLGSHVDMTYDGSGRRLTATRYDGTTPLTTTFGYDGADLVSVRDPLNRLTELFPDAVGRIVTTKDPLGRFTRLAYDDLNRVIQTTDAQGQSESWSYDGNGNRIAFTDAKNQVTAFSYDPRNRLKSKQDALLKTETYDYDLGGNPIFITDRRGLVTGHVYDALDRRIQTGFGATSTATPSYTSTINYTYDAANRLTAAQDSVNGIITRSYDDRFDAIAQEVSPQGTVDYTYSADGQRQSMNPSGGSTITYAYDGAHRLTEITQAAGLGGAIPATAQTVGFSYDTANRPTGVTLPNGITLTYGYDAASQLSAITYKKADGTTIGDLTYIYNAVGDRIATGGSLARTDLPSAIATTQYDVNNRLLGRDGTALSYDDNGNLTSDGTRSYTWNERNQLAGISGADTASYSYDALGRRSTAAINGQTTGTLYDGWNPVQLQAGGVAVENRLVGLGLDTNFARTRSGVTESYLSDALGSTLELRNAAQNQTVEYTYDPYGNTASSVVSTNGIKYTGREQDLEDLYYYRNRYYKPSVGQFISEDPIGLIGGSNLYVYVENNPANWIDPEGLASSGKTVDLGGGTTVRIDNPHVPGQQEHAHVESPKGEAVVNKDGTQSHKGKGNLDNLNNKAKDFLRGKGFKIPGIPLFLNPCALDPSMPFCTPPPPQYPGCPNT
jgi:RHS repeat-associated protein